MSERANEFIRSDLSKAQVNWLRDELQKQQDEVARLKELINRPYIGIWADEIVIEAAHQKERWGAEHDAGKAPEDFFWLVGYLAGKALASHKANDLVKAYHHTVSTAAVLAHWAARINGNDTIYRPGIGSEKIIGVE